MKHICSSCKKEFKTEKEYLNHKCEKTGFKPTQVEHLDKLSNGKFSLQSKKALERGKKRKK